MPTDEPEHPRSVTFASRAEAERAARFLTSCGIPADAIRLQADSHGDGDGASTDRRTVATVVARALGRPSPSEPACRLVVDPVHRALALELLRPFGGGQACGDGRPQVRD